MLIASAANVFRGERVSLLRIDHADLQHPLHFPLVAQHPCITGLIFGSGFAIDSISSCAGIPRSNAANSSLYSRCSSRRSIYIFDGVCLGV